MRKLILVLIYLVVTARYLVVTGGYCLLPFGYWWLLLISTFSMKERSPIQKCDFNKVAEQKLLDKSAFLGMSTSLDDIKIKIITMY